jgi:hypothetical protein
LPIALFFRLSSAQSLPLLASPCQVYYAYNKRKEHLFVLTERRQGGNTLNLNPQANSQQKVALKSTEIHKICESTGLHRINRFHRFHRVHRIHKPGSPVIFC